MGYDLLGWRNCKLQQAYEPQTFLQAIKQRARALHVAEIAPLAETFQTKTLTLDPASPKETQGQQSTEAGSLFSDEDLMTCDACPLAGGESLGCWNYTPYPIDTTFEELAWFDFLNDVRKRDTPVRIFYEQVVHYAESDAWRDARGEVGLAQRPEPIVDDIGGVELSSDVLLAAVFGTLTLDGIEALEATTRYLDHLIHRFDALATEPATGRVSDELDINWSAPESLSAIALWAGAQEGLQDTPAIRAELARRIEDSTTIATLRGMHRIMRTVRENLSDSGEWTMIVDA